LKTAIVILNWNGATLLERFLPSVVKHSKSAQIYVADNGSTDHSKETVVELFPNVKWIQLDKNYGFVGYNKALENLEEDLFCLLNSDIEVTEGWLEPIELLFERQEEIAIAQPKILDYKDKTRFEYAGAAGGYLDFFAYPYCRGRVFQYLEEDKGQYDDSRQVFWATGACMFVRSSVFKSLGGFDSSYFAHQEEIDLCWRANNQGYQVYYIGSSQVYHLGGSTLSNMNPKKTFLNFRNSLFNILKNLPLLHALVIVLSRLILDGVAGIVFLLQGKAKHTLAIIKAHFSFYYHAKSIYKKRINSKSKPHYYRHFSIVYSYFVLGKEKFSDLTKL
jgi:GT2 family glycosyltransferase